MATVRISPAGATLASFATARHQRVAESRGSVALPQRTLYWPSMVSELPSKRKVSVSMYGVSLKVSFRVSVLSSVHAALAAMPWSLMSNSSLTRLRKLVVPRCQAPMAKAIVWLPSASATVRVGPLSAKSNRTD